MSYLDELCQVGDYDTHHLVCNYHLRPMGSPGCICYRLRREAVLELLDELYPGWDDWSSIVNGPRRTQC